MDESIPERVAREYRYDALTWQEINEAVVQEKVVVLPVGSTEQHGHHLPLDMDNKGVTEVVMAAAKIAPDKMLVLPTVAYGYTHHVMDFPGTITIEPSTFIRFLLDIARSVAYHGFRRIIVVNGHGSNHHLIDQVSRQVNLQTEALCMCLSYWSLGQEKWNEIRTSGMGGSAHAGELETSLYLHFDRSGVREDRVKGDIPEYMALPGADEWYYRDLTLGAGVANIMEWTSAFSPTGANGLPEHATAEKGEILFEHIVERFAQLTTWFKHRPDLKRRTFHAVATPDRFPFEF